MAMMQSVPMRLSARPKEGRRTPGSPTKVSSLAMATRAPKFVWAARDASAASRAAVASAQSTRAGAVTSRAARLGSGFFGSRLAGAAWSRLRIGPSDFGRLGPDVLPGRSCVAQVQTRGDASGEHLQDVCMPVTEDIESNEFARAFCEFWGRILSDAPSCSSPREIIDPYPDGVDVTEKDLESDEALWALYEHWCKVFNKKRDHAEMVRLFPVFKMTATTVHSWNTYVPPDPRKAAAFLKGKKKAERRLAKGLDVPSCYESKVLGPFADGVDQEMGSPVNAAY
ncbi:unnamed protein product [Urochloa decumbens]|uniref:Cathepsin propeptide inhibitor domain-containing protein n=1 Tax=Urochloa decumbens TaxID=240449 RepID=A0ABC8XFC0_9POAL